MLINSTLSGMDVVVYRFETPNGEFIQDVVYNNKISEEELREWIKYRHGYEPTEIEVAR